MAKDATQLLHRIAEGDGRAMEEFCALHADALFRYALVRLGDRDLAEDVVQDTLIAVWRSASTYHGASEVSTWLFGICRHKVADIARKRGFTETVGLPEIEQRPCLERTQFWECFSRLTDEDRELLLLVFHYGFSQEEVAQIVGIPAGTVKSRTFYARRRLQALLQRGE